jgi:hypothetical protein
VTVAAGDIVIVKNPNLPGGTPAVLGIVMAPPDGNNNVVVAHWVNGVQYTVNNSAITAKVTPVAP